MTKPKIPDRSALEQLPPAARVLLAARCAGRVEPLFAAYRDKPPEQWLRAIDTAVSFAELSAYGDDRKCRADDWSSYPLDNPPEFVSAVHNVARATSANPRDEPQLFVAARTAEAVTFCAWAAFIARHEQSFGYVQRSSSDEAIRTIEAAAEAGGTAAFEGDAVVGATADDYAKLLRWSNEKRKAPEADEDFGDEADIEWIKAFVPADLLGQLWDHGPPDWLPQSQFAPTDDGKSVQGHRGWSMLTDSTPSEAALSILYCLHCQTLLDECGPGEQLTSELQPFGPCPVCGKTNGFNVLTSDLERIAGRKAKLKAWKGMPAKRTSGPESRGRLKPLWKFW